VGESSLIFKAGRASDVGFGSLADIAARARHVRLTRHRTFVGGRWDVRKVPLPDMRNASRYRIVMSAYFPILGLFQSLLG
jgi:hypothetical protein